MENLGPLVLVGAMAVGLVFIVRLRKRSCRLDAKRFFPTADPAASRERLRQWWEAEFMDAGVSGTPEVEHRTWSESEVAWSALKSAVQSLLFSTSQQPAAHVYRTRIPAAPVPLEAWVFTNEQGWIIRVVYEAVLARPCAGESAYLKDSPFPASFTGADEQRLNAAPGLKAAVRACLHFGYTVPGQAIATSMSLLPAALKVLPADEGRTRIVIQTLLLTTELRGEFMFGLREVLQAVRAIEALPS